MSALLLDLPSTEFSGKDIGPSDRADLDRLKKQDSRNVVGENVGAASATSLAHELPKVTNAVQRSVAFYLVYPGLRLSNDNTSLSIEVNSNGRFVGNDQARKADLSIAFCHLRDTREGVHVLYSSGKSETGLELKKGKVVDVDAANGTVTIRRGLMKTCIAISDVLGIRLTSEVKDSKVRTNGELLHARK